MLHRARPDGRSSYGCAHAVQSRAEPARCRAALQMDVEIGERPVWRQLRATCISARCANADRGFPYDTAMCTTATNSATPGARKIAIWAKPMTISRLRSGMMLSLPGHRASTAESGANDPKWEYKPQG